MTYAKSCPQCHCFGAHYSWCVMYYYQYPSTPAPVKPPPAPVQGDCPCGRARAGCEYHDPALQPVEAAPTQRTYEVEDLTINGAPLCDCASCSRDREALQRWKTRLGPLG